MCMQLWGTVQTLSNFFKGGGGKQSVTAHPYCIKKGQKPDIGREEGGGSNFREFVLRNVSLNIFVKCSLLEAVISNLYSIIKVKSI